MRRKILMGVLALALPTGTVLATQSLASAGGSTPNPVNCSSFNATVTFATPISKNGTFTKSSKSGPTVVSGGSFSCSGGTAPNTGGAGSLSGGTLSIKGGKNAKNTSYSKTSCKANPSDPSVCDKYVTGSQAEFTAAGPTLAKSVKKINLIIGGAAVQFKVTGSNEVVGGACAGDVGFDLLGSVAKGNYIDKTDAHILACLGHDTGPGTTNSFGVDLFSPTAQIVTANIDPSVSLAKL
jgi:hypothetical protein